MVIARQNHRFPCRLGPWGILLISFIDTVGIPHGGRRPVGHSAFGEQPGFAPAWVTLAVLVSSAANMVLFYVSRKGGERLMKVEAPESQRGDFASGSIGMTGYGVHSGADSDSHADEILCGGSGALVSGRFISAHVLLLESFATAPRYLGVQMGEH